MAPAFRKPTAPRAVERFVRLEQSRSQPGSGLGLSLASAVARLHGGELRLEDNKPGLKSVIALPRGARRDTVPDEIRRRAAPNARKKNFGEASAPQARAKGRRQRRRRETGADTGKNSRRTLRYQSRAFRREGREGAGRRLARGNAGESAAES